MNEQGLKPTDVSKIARPVEVVQLKHLRTEDGEPVCVRCEAVDELVAMESNGNPGEHAPIDEAKLTLEQKRARAKKNLDEAAAVVHLGTSFVSGDSIVRPAFHYDEAHAVPGSIPWRYVSVEDKVLIVNTVLRLTGYGGAEDARFPRRNG
jgi:hypothetical protein